MADIKPDGPGINLFQILVAYKMANDGNSPSLRELMVLTGYKSTSVIKYQLDELERLGMVKRIPGHHRIWIKGGQWRMTE